MIIKHLGWNWEHREEGIAKQNEIYFKFRAVEQGRLRAYKLTLRRVRTDHCCCGKSESTTYGDWAGSLVAIGTELRAGQSGIYYRWTDRDISPVKTGPWDQQASCKMGGKLSNNRIRSRTVQPVSQSIYRMSHTAKTYIYIYIHISTL